MRWLDRLSPATTDFRVNTSIFVFEDDFSATSYATLLEEIETAPHMEVIDNLENWDQTGLLTRVLTYKTFKGVFDE